MEESVLDRIRRLEAERGRLKQEALDKVMQGIAELNELGFTYELRERRAKPNKKGPRKPPANAEREV